MIAIAILVSILMMIAFNGFWETIFSLIFCAIAAMAVLMAHL
jgi:hypothetical protein